MVLSISIVSEAQCAERERKRETEGGLTGKAKAEFHSNFTAWVFLAEQVVKESWSFTNWWTQSKKLWKGWSIMLSNQKVTLTADGARRKGLKITQSENTWLASENVIWKKMLFVSKRKWNFKSNRWLLPFLLFPLTWRVCCYGRLKQIFFPLFVQLTASTASLLWDEDAAETKSGFPSVQTVWPAFVCVCVCEKERMIERGREREKKVGDLLFYLMASHISRPIFTQFLAWSGRDSGRPDTQ